MLRVHPSQGNYFKVEVLKLGEVDGNGGFTKLNGSKDLYILLLPIPIGINGSEGKAKLSLFWSGGTNHILSISPPVRELSIEQIDELDEPFKRSLDYILDLLKGLGWRFGKVEITGDLHFAIPLGDRPHPLLNELIRHGLHKLSTGEREEDIVFWWDNSHDRAEIETTDKRMAIDILHICECQFKALPEV